jgi:hypothetical protein
VGCVLCAWLIIIACVWRHTRQLLGAVECVACGLGVQVNLVMARREVSRGGGSRWADSQQVVGWHVRPQEQSPRHNHTACTGGLPAAGQLAAFRHLSQST